MQHKGYKACYFGLGGYEAISRGLWIPFSTILGHADPLNHQMEAVVDLDDLIDRLLDYV